MAEQSFWDMLRTKRDSLTKSGIIVADYLMQHAEDAQYLSISSLAKACGVAELRFSVSAAPWALTAITR